MQSITSEIHQLFTEREYFSSGVKMLTNGLRILDTTKTAFFGAESLSECQKNMTKILPCRFKQFFELFNTLTVHKCSTSVLTVHKCFRHLQNPTFSSLLFQKGLTYEGHLFFSKYSKFYLHSKKAQINWTNIFLI